MSPRVRRRPNISRARRRHDVAALRKALDARDLVVDEAGSRVDLSVGVRIEAVQALAEISDEGADAALAHALDDPDPRVVATALAAVAARPSPVATEAVARGVIDWSAPEHAELREAALAYLRAREDPAIATGIVDRMHRTAAPRDLTPWEAHVVRELFAVPGGAEAAAQSARDIVGGLAAQDQHARARARALLVAAGGGTVDTLIEALEDPVARGNAAAALGAARDQRAVPGLIRLLRADAPAADRARAAEALGAIRDPAAAEALLAAASDPDADVRYAAHDALDRLGIAGLLAIVHPRSLHPARPDNGTTAAGDQMRTEVRGQPR
jgi:HEAT repeat protein